MFHFSSFFPEFLYALWPKIIRKRHTNTTITDLQSLDFLTFLKILFMVISKFYRSHSPIFSDFHLPMQSLSMAFIQLIVFFIFFFFLTFMNSMSSHISSPFSSWHLWKGHLSVEHFVFCKYDMCSLNCLQKFLFVLSMQWVVVLLCNFKGILSIPEVL